MSAASIETILSRAMSDNAFADLLLTKPDQALAGYDLTAEEAANLKRLTPADFHAFASASPEERKSFSWFNHNQTALHIRI